MGIHSKLAPEVQEVDVIIAGGGTAACVIAGRLAAADPNLSILVIEYGKDNHNNPLVRTPALYPMHLQPDSETTIFYKSTKSKNMADRESIVPAGGVLGGGSSINFLMYTRAQRSDFDSWNTAGWSADEMMPYLKKLETYHGPGDAEHHGFSGPIAVTDGNFRCKKTEDDWMQAAAKMGHRESRDAQALDGDLGFQRWLRYVTPEGQRCDAAHAYLHPLLQDGAHPNLHVLTESVATRILFENDSSGTPRACAVECEPNPRFQQFAAVGLNPHPKQTIRARKLVVSACGAIGSPLLLERSGLGDPEILKEAGVTNIVRSLPGVGKEYEDHQLSLFPYKTNLDPQDTIDDLLSQRRGPEALAELGQLGWNAIDISSKIRPHETDVDALGPEFRKAWDRDFRGAGKEDRPLMLMATVNGYLGDHTSLDPNTRYTMVGSYTAYPYSRGHVHISSVDPFQGGPTGQGLDFDVGFFSDPDNLDVKAQIWAYKLGREIMRRTDMFTGEMAEFHPKFPEGSKAAVQEGHVGGKKEVLQDIVYTAEDDKAIEEHLRAVIATTWHGLGTARMAPEDEGGVVDGDLNVHGVRGLKVADLSICPQNIGANTNNTALVIGEKAADIIGRELGLVV